MKKIMLLTIIVATLFSCNQSKKDSKEKAVAEPYKLQQTIFYGGDIITMEGDSPEYVEAVVQREGKIIFVGSKEEAFKRFEGKAKKHDLHGETMMPGFIEPHAHPVSIGAFILANDIVAPHEWRMPHKTYPGVSGKENYLKAVKEIIDSKKDKTKTVLIWGYHKSWHGVLTLKDLDKVTGDVPTIIWQRSTHEIFLNTACAKKYGVKKGDLSKEDNEQADWDNYHFWERAYQMMKGTKLAPFFGDQEMLKRGMDRISQLMLQNGLTAMMEPSFPNSSFEDEYAVLVDGTEKAKAYTIFLIAGFPEQFVKKIGNDAYEAHIDSLPGLYNTEYIKFLPKQFKTFADGAIYSLALQLLDGFINCPTCHSEWIIPLEPAQEIFNYWWDKGYKIHIHITGDLAYDKYLDFVEAAMKRNPRKNHRTTFHHVGLFNAEQAQRTADLGVEISANPYYLWALADKYSETGLGPQRASHMVSLKEFTKRGIPVSLHSDFAMAPAEPLLLAWVAATRIVASGKVMSPEERISVYDAMKGITITAARTFEMENVIGSIKEGKEATFTILRENPFKIEPEKLKDIPIVGVVYKGRFILNKKTALRGAKNSSTQVNCKAINGYFAKNTIQFNNNFKHFVLTNQHDFDNYFGVAKTMKNKVDKVDFKKNFIVAVVTKSSKIPKEIKPVYCDLENDKLTIKYKITEGKENSFMSSGLYLATVPKDGISSVIFRTRNDVELIEVNSTKKSMPGGWSETEVTPEVEKALNFVLQQMNTSAKLDKITHVKTQVVAGINYDIDFKLDNGEVWNTIVYRDLKGNYKMTKVATLKK